MGGIIQTEKISERELQEFERLGGRMFEIYHKLPQSGSKRKIFGAHDKNGWLYNIMFFQGPKEDMDKVQKFLNEMVK